MASFDPADMTASPSGIAPQDMQLLASLLGSLLAVLQRGPMGNAMGTPMGATMAGPMGNPMGNPMGSAAPRADAPLADYAQLDRRQLDQMAALALARDLTADSLRRLSAFCEQVAGQHPSLAPCIGIVTEAARSFAAGDYNGSLTLIWEAYRVIAAARAAHPGIPSPHEGTAAPTLSH